jgi:hypothetical protein
VVNVEVVEAVSVERFEETERMVVGAIGRIGFVGTSWVVTLARVQLPVRCS